jgi:hypothetical protein
VRASREKNMPRRETQISSYSRALTALACWPGGPKCVVSKMRVKRCATSASCDADAAVAAAAAARPGE